MKPAWDDLMKEYRNHSSILVADVDCTGAGKSLCDEEGIKGFPTLKYGDPYSLTDYSGGRSYVDLKKFVSTDLKPMCSPFNLDVCGPEERKQIEEYSNMGHAKREALIKEHNDEIEKLESDFKTTVDKLREEYQKASDKKEEDLKAQKPTELGWLKAMRAAAKEPKADAPATAAEL